MMVIWALLLFLLLALSEADSQDSSSKSKEEEDPRRQGLIQDAVKSLLGLSSQSSEMARRPPPVPPTYMLQLYDRYRAGMVPDQRRKGNTVRSILSMRGKAEGVEMLVFNLTGVQPSEQILQGELHFFKRRRLKSGPAGNKRQQDITGFRLQLVDLTREDSPVMVGHVNVHQDVSGWQLHDVTRAVASCRQHPGAEHHLLGVKAEVIRRDGKTRVVSIRKVLRLSSQPFLIIFSEDNNNQTVEETFEMRASLHQYLASLNANVTRRPRTKRSLLDNELPDSPISWRTLMDMQQHGRKVDLTAVVLPHPSQLQPKHKASHSKKKKQRRRKNGGRRLPQFWQQYHQYPARHENDASLNRPDHPSSLCQRKKLVVDLSDIGWSEWVISPKTFETHYCSGHCSFPLNKLFRPSNHATIQSLLNAIGLFPDVPAPCCVPDVLSSITLLYFDENLNVVLKSYPGMTVESCACL